MRKLILIISILFTVISLAEARECKSGDIKGDAFIYSDGKKVTVIKGTDTVSYTHLTLPTIRSV